MSSSLGCQCANSEKTKEQRAKDWCELENFRIEHVHDCGQLAYVGIDPSKVEKDKDLLKQLGLLLIHREILRDKTQGLDFEIKQMKSILDNSFEQ